MRVCFQFFKDIQGKKHFWINYLKGVTTVMLLYNTMNNGFELGLAVSPHNLCDIRVIYDWSWLKAIRSPHITWLKLLPPYNVPRYFFFWDFGHLLLVLSICPLSGTVRFLSFKTVFVNRVNHIKLDQNSVNLIIFIKILSSVHLIILYTRSYSTSRCL